MMKKPILKISALSFGYDRSKEIISDFSADFYCGQRVCIEAASGEGKTTFFRLICGLEKPDKGSLEFYPSRPKIALVSQKNDIFPWYNALKNVCLVSDEKTARRFLEAVGLRGHENKLPSELSGGMLRRLAIAKALAYDAEILILDEAFSGTDSERAGDIMDLLEKEYKDKLIIFTTHNRFEMDEFATDIIKLK